RLPAAIQRPQGLRRRRARARAAQARRPLLVRAREVPADQPGRGHGSGPETGDGQDPGAQPAPAAAQAEAVGDPTGDRTSRSGGSGGRNIGWLILRSGDLSEPAVPTALPATPCPAFGRCGRTRRTPGKAAASPARSPDAAGATTSAATRSPPTC